LTAQEYDKLAQFMDHTVTALLSLMQGAQAWEGKNSGAVFCVVSRNTGQPIHPPYRIGTAPEEKLRRFERLATIVKPGQLIGHPSHESSWQSRDPEQDLWGGAVAMSDDDIFALSGLPELADEGTVLAGGHAHYGDVLLPRLDDVASISSNPYWSVLRLLGKRL
jgi:hypothetical protein